jgi:hypothetical protein
MTSENDDSRTGFQPKASAWFRHQARSKLYATALEACGKLVWHERTIVPHADLNAVKAISVLGVVLRMFASREVRSRDAKRLDRLLEVVQNQDLPKKDQIARAVEIVRTYAPCIQAAKDDDKRARLLEELAAVLWAEANPRWIELAKDVGRAQWLKPEERARLASEGQIGTHQDASTLGTTARAALEVLTAYSEESKGRPGKRNVYSVLVGLSELCGGLDLPTGKQYREANEANVLKSHVRSQEPDRDK